MRGNSISIKGGITRDAEFRMTNTGKTVAAWGIAWSKSRKNPSTGEWEDVPHYFDVECWLSEKQQKQLEQLLKKGARCAIIDGHIEYTSWEKNGEKRSRVLIVVDEPINGLLISGEPIKKQEQVENGIYDDDIPF